MCVVCGCGQQPQDSQTVQPITLPKSQPIDLSASFAAPTVAGADLHYGQGEAGVSVPGLSQTRTIRLEADVLGANNRVADRNRAHFYAHGVSALNLVSSPGSGKTTLLCATIEALRTRMPHLPIGVIEGDQQTSVDADRIRATGAPAIQINTGKGCHLDAVMVADAFERLPLHGAVSVSTTAHHHDGPHGEHAHAPTHHHQQAHSHDHSHGHHHAEKLLFIENVGNLVCPAMWDLGEAAKVVILSVTEGDDKPLKYPDMFAAASLMLINKIDLLPHVNFDVARCIAQARRINPGIAVLELSATTGAGMDAWLSWLMHVEPRLARA